LALILYLRYCMFVHMVVALCTESSVVAHLDIEQVHFVIA